MSVHAPARRRSRSKLTVLALGAVGLATTLTLAAFAAPDRTPRAANAYLPADAKQVIARVPTRDAAEIAARRALAASPDNLDVAVQLARVDLERYRTLVDPRYLGRAQATLARWWKLADAPPDVLLLRATINRALRELPAARADLDRLVAVRPSDDAHLLRAQVAMLTASYTAARESCTAIANPLVAATCEAPIAGIHGGANAAYATLADLLARTAAGPSARAAALAELAELALQQGDLALATRHVTDALAVDDTSVHVRDLAFDILYAAGRHADAAKLLAGREAIDSHLARLALAEHQLHGARFAGMMRERIDAAALRGDRVHPRDEARFALVVESSPARAVELAAENWKVQKELADARLLAEAAAAAGDPAAAEPVRVWARTTGVHDAALAKVLP